MIVSPFLFYSLVVLCLFLFAFLSVSIYYNYKHAILILNLIDNVEESLSILDEKYRSVSDILDIPLFYDSPQIRKVHEDISLCRDSILNVASLIGNVESITDEEMQQ